MEEEYNDAEVQYKYIFFKSNPEVQYFVITTITFSYLCFKLWLGMVLHDLF